MQDVFEKGQNLDPKFRELYYEMTNYLQPKWHGKESSDWENWLDSALKHPKLSKEDALVLYREVVGENLKNKYNEPIPNKMDFYEFYGVDRKRFLKGLAACCKRYSGSSSWPSVYFYHACMADDKVAIKEALELMDFMFDAGVIEEKQFYNILDSIEKVYPEILPKASK